MEERRLMVGMNFRASFVIKASGCFLNVSLSISTTIRAGFMTILPKQALKSAADLDFF
jgi:hypothetical protein